MRIVVALVSGLLAVLAIANTTEADLVLVVCAPGYPGKTDTAQPVMDEFAAEVSRGTGESVRRVRAVYHPIAEGGVKALAESAAGLALVGMPFFLEYREKLDLVPILAVEPNRGALESWSLVARSGAVSDPSSLSGWRIVSIAGFSRDFVERVALFEFGVLPADVTIEFSARVLAELRNAIKGEKTAVLLDTVQTDGIPFLPFAAELQVVTHSRPHLASLLCTVGGRVSQEEAAAVTRVLLGLHETETGRNVLEAMLITRFNTVDLAEVTPLERAFSAQER